MLTPSHRLLLDTVDERRLGMPGRLEDGRGDVDHMGELACGSRLRLDAGRPVDDRAVAGAAPVRGDLLRPLVRRAHRVGPADRVVVVGVRAAEVVQPLDHELGRLQLGGAVEVDHLVVGAVDRALGRGAVVADDVVDERVVEDAQLLDARRAAGRRGGRCTRGSPRRPPSGGEYRLELLGHVVPGRDLLVALRQLGVRRDHAQFLLSGEGLLAQRVPALVERALVLVGPLGRTWCGAWVAPGAK